jgi:hypothetical protein
MRPQQLHAASEPNCLAPMRRPSTHRDVVELGVLDAGVLPGLGQQAVVPVDVVGVKAELALLDVLLDGSVCLILRRAWLGEGGSEKESGSA